MNKITKFKRFEKNIYEKTIVFFNALKSFFKALISFIYSVVTHKITVMLIPHSEKKIVNLRINVFILSIFLTFLFTSIGFITFLAIDNYKKSSMYLEASIKSQTNEKISKEYKDMLNQIFESHKLYNMKLNNIVSKINSPTINAIRENYIDSQGGPLNQIGNESISELELNKIKTNNLLVDYNLSIAAFNDISEKLNRTNEITSKLPFGSPVRGPYFITSKFGIRIHPVFKVLDFHTGIDLVSEYGTPIVATAPGTVEKVQTGAIGYGNYVQIRHDRGFSTLYAHLRSYIVIPGQKIQKGQIIGYMGNTGTSTGVHLHYEVRLNGKPDDPYNYLNIY